MGTSTALFIIGYPRSGTKLLRDLLNNHPEVALGGEGNFIPSITNRIGLEADVSSPKLWPEIYQALSETSFYVVNPETKTALSSTEFVQLLERRSATAPMTWASIYETIFRTLTPAPQAHTARFFGDKSHKYVQSVPLLREIFDDLRLILIVRDPRDQALSVASTWGRSPLRSAQGWFRMAEAAEKYGLEHATDTLTIRYEDLTRDSSRELARACEFLDIPFLSNMAVLKKAVEKRTKDLKVVASEPARYKKAFSPATVRQISEITLPYLAKYGYPTEGAKRHRKLGNLQLRWLKYRDGLASMRYHMKDKGVIAGFDYYRKRHFDTSK